MIEQGQTAPDFTLPQDGGDDLTLSALRGRPVVLYFYPRDDTSGCTTEAKDFSGRIADFQTLGAAVLGVSKDTVAKHAKFRTKHELEVTLLSDDQSDVCVAYGVWVEKKMYGKTYQGIERSTFLIDADGIVRHIWRKVKVPGHADAVLTALRAL